MRFKYGPNDSATWESRSIITYMVRRRTPTRVAADNYGPIMQFGPKHSLVFFVELDGSVNATHVKGV